MNHSPSLETYSFLASQEIPRILWHQIVHRHIQKRPPPVPILSQINPVHATSHFLNLYFNVILPYTPKSHKWPLSLRPVF